MGDRLKKKKAETESGRAGESWHDPEVIRQRIKENAYGLYLERGQVHGHDFDDWLEAERRVLEEINSKQHSKPKTVRKKTTIRLSGPSENLRP